MRLSAILFSISLLASGTLSALPPLPATRPPFESSEKESVRNTRFIPGKELCRFQGEAAQVICYKSGTPQLHFRSPDRRFGGIAIQVDGKDVKGEDIDIVSRLVFMQKMHKTHPVTGTVCMSTAARIPSSIVNRNLSERGKAERRIWIGHPAGVIPAVSVLDNVDGEYKLRTAAILRTARVIMDGTVYVRRSRVE